MNQIATIVAEVTFLPTEEGGRRIAVPFLSSCIYRPHLVVQSPDIRQAVVAPGNILTEEYLGVCFLEGPADGTAGQPLPCVLALVYHPGVDYSRLQSGATFTVREGAQIVGFGTVLSRTDDSSAQSTDMASNQPFR